MALTAARRTLPHRNGARVTGDTLPGSTALISLEGAQILSNGKGRGAEAAECENMGCVFEKNEGGCTRLKMARMEGVVMEDNAGGLKGNRVFEHTVRSE